jgi:hypothetical protein
MKGVKKMKNLILCFMMVILSISVTSRVFAVAYTWNLDSIAGDWQNSANWTPARTTPATSDVLIFDGNSAATAIVNNIALESVSAVSVINNCFATITTPTITNNQVTLNGGDGALYVGAGSQLRLVGSGVTTGFVISSTSKGYVDGDIVVRGATGRVRITVLQESGLIFRNGSSAAIVQSGGGTNPGMWDGSVNHGIVFQSGASFHHGATKDTTILSFANPADQFGTLPINYMKMESGSNYYYNTVRGFPNFGRTFGNFIWRSFAGLTCDGVIAPAFATMTVLNDFRTMSPFTTIGGSGSLVLGGTADPGVVILGNLIIDADSFPLADAGSDGVTNVLSTTSRFEVHGDVVVNGVFTLSTSADRIYEFNGSSAQSVKLATGGDVTLPNLTIDNAAGVTSQNGIQVDGTLDLAAGYIDMSGGYITVAPTGTVNQTAGWVVGNLVSSVPGSTGPVLFPVGSVSNYNGATVDFTVAPTAGVVTAAFRAQNPGSDGLPLGEGIVGVQPNGYWSISGGIGGTYDITLLANGFPYTGSGASELRVLKRADGSSPWTLEGSAGTNSGTDPNYVVSRTGLTGFSDFAIGGAVLPPTSAGLWPELID